MKRARVSLSLSLPVSCSINSEKGYLPMFDPRTLSRRLIAADASQSDPWRGYDKIDESCLALLR